MCGEKLDSLGMPAHLIGSPPRVRGKVNLLSGEQKKEGITPACAGKSQSVNHSPENREDHPRVCGEKFVLHILTSFDKGSPPRVRGKAETLNSLTIAVRITPACAGKRLGQIIQQIAAEDHPRVCGEKSLRAIVRASCLGSPPRVRGKAVSAGMFVPAGRITPACAGKSSLSLIHI